MEKHHATWITLFLALLPLWMSGQENLKIKDPNGNVLLEAREEGVLVRKMTTAEREVVAGLDADDNGLLVYDTDTRSLWIWQDPVWVEIDGVDLVNDADHDPTNELQEWATLPGIPDDFLDGIDNVDDADHDPTNELQEWATLPGIPDDFLDGIDNVDDADADPANELNTSLSLEGTMLELTDSGGTLSADLAGLINDDDWTVDSEIVYNTDKRIGIGTDAPTTSLHIKGNKGPGEHVMLIENLNHEGSGLQIKIDGSHPLFVTGQGGNPDFFVTHPGAAIVDVFEPLVTDIRTYLMNNGSLDVSQVNFSQVTSPGGLLDQLGLVDFVSGGICKGAGTLVDLINGIGLESITIPDLPLDDIPQDIPDIPVNLPTLSIPNFSWNPPDPGITVGPYEVSIPLGPWTVPTSTLNNTVAIQGFNDAITLANSNNELVNTALENGYDKLKDGLMLIDGLEIPLPQLQVPQTIGPITCPDPNPWDDFSFSFESLNPLDYNIINPLTSTNAFITFSDQYDNRLGAITGQGMGEFSVDYFNKEKVLEIGSHVTGLISDDGNIAENVFSLGKEVIEFYKASDKIGVLYSSGHGDYAEWLERENIEEVIGYGDIVGVRGGKISLSLRDAEQVMVVSKAPIVLGNIPEPGKEGTGNNVAFIGQVPVKVMGPVHTGDFIIANPATPGFGMAVPEKDITTEQMTLAVGKSWETNTNPGFKFVNTIVGMHNHGWAAPMTKLQTRVDAQEAALQALTARLDELENVYGMAGAHKPSRR